MKNDFFISIVIPVYNVSKYLDACIKSVINQSYTNFELILIDDGSTDGSGVICDNWSKKSKRIFVIHQSNHGSSYSRNKGISNAKGDYITFLDSDDYWMSKDFLKDINNRLKITNPDVLSFNFSKIFKNDESSVYFQNIASMPKELDDLSSFDYQIKNNLWIACAWNKVIKKDLFDNNELLFVEGITSEDIDWSARLALKCSKFDYINILGVGYNQRFDSISKLLDSKKLTVLLNNILVTESLINTTNDIKGNLLKSYLAYQIVTLILNFSFLNEKDVLKNNLDMLKNLCKYLPNSNNRKIRLLYYVIRLLGVKNTISVIKIIRSKG